MKKILLPILAVVSLMAVSYHANAATTPPSFNSFDFGTIANGNEQGATTFEFTDNGVTLTATAGNANPYLDSGNAGLGVCKELTIATKPQCGGVGGPADDNVTNGEILKLVFDHEITIKTLTFKNGSHGDIFAGQYKLEIDTGGWVKLALANMTNANLTGTEFRFYNFEGTSDNETQFYINQLSLGAKGACNPTFEDCVSTVPVPAAAWLFTSGILGLVGIARRKATI